MHMEICYFHYMKTTTFLDIKFLHKAKQDMVNLVKI